MFPRSTSSRHGLSLVEVLISVGVLGAGLLGVAMLMPLAHHLAREGVHQDRQATAGKRAYREFRVRGMANPLNWRTVSGEPVNPFRLYMPTAPPSFLPPNAPATAPLMRMAYCIDPLTISELLRPSGPLPPGVQPMRPDSIQWFPHFEAGAGGVSMQRISLASQSNPQVPMLHAHAQRVFTLEDDLIFDIPDRDDLPPQQRWLTTDVDATNQSPVPELRLASGRFSWFATLVPLLDRSSDDFRLSVVVTSERLPAEDWQRELVGDVSFIGGGFAGGDVRLEFDVSKLANLNGPLINDDPFLFKPGMWLMLAQLRQQLDPVTGRNIQVRDYGWYRIIATNKPLDPSQFSSGGPQNTSKFFQEVTLHGADWNIAAPLTKAFYIPGVTAVYEKTIKLETSALWN